MTIDARFTLALATVVAAWLLLERLARLVWGWGK
jgi:hypothetical protein